MMKKMFVGMFVTLLSVLSLAFIMPTPVVSAEECNTDIDSSFLGFPTWYRGLCKKGTDEIEDFADKEPSTLIFTIALNVLDILLRVVGLLAVGFVVWGGVQYVISNGEPDKAKKALDTILKAGIGMAIAMMSAIIVGFVVARMSS